MRLGVVKGECYPSMCDSSCKVMVQVRGRPVPERYYVMTSTIADGYVYELEEHEELWRRCWDLDEFQSWRTRDLPKVELVDVEAFEKWRMSARKGYCRVCGEWLQQMNKDMICWRCRRRKEKC
jgi:hypothetical protein